MKTIDKWHMTDEEIRRSWKRAEDRAAQIGIIAQLNNRTKDDVIKKLQELGEDVEVVGRKLRCKIDKEDDRKIWRLRFDGMTYHKIVNFLTDRPTEETVRRRYESMRDEYKRALPTVKRTLQAFIEEIPEEDRETIRRFIWRYL